MPKRNEGRDRILANVLIGLGIAVILAVIGACIYFSYEVAPAKRRDAGGSSYCRSRSSS